MTDAALKQVDAEIESMMSLEHHGAAASTGSMSAPQRFCILGPLEIWNKSDAISISAARQRTLLAILLAKANQPISVDVLVDELWTDPVPLTARKTVQGYVWRLRRRLGPLSGRLTTVDSTYRMVLADDALDALDFQRLVASARTALQDGRQQDAIDDLTRARWLWRGAPFAGVPLSRTLENCAAWLEEAKLIADELLLATQCEIGQESQVVPELVVLATAHPCRESLHRLLMTALYRTGRRGEALAVFGQLGRALADDYGIDPQHETVSLYEAILHDTVENTAGPGPLGRDAMLTPAGQER